MFFTCNMAKQFLEYFEFLENSCNNRRKVIRSNSQSQLKLGSDTNMLQPTIGKYFTISTLTNQYEQKIIFNVNYTFI